MKKSIKRECRNLILDTELHQDFLDNLDSYYQPIEDVIMGIYDACENDYFVNGLGEKTPYRDEYFCELMCTQYEEAFYNSDAVKDASYEVGGRMVREWAIIIWDNRRALFADRQKIKTEKILAKLREALSYFDEDSAEEDMARDMISTYEDYLEANELR